jgi:Acetyltransferases, including N-acetylases of ribosomal proteins
MYRLVYDRTDELLRWAAERIGVERFKDDAKAIGQERNGEICAVVVYDCFSETDCNMHIASDGSRKWLTRDLLVAAFSFPFVQCGFRRVTGLVPASNEAALRFDEHIGFRREGYHPLAAPDGGDLISLGLLRKDCRYIPARFRND